MLKLILINMLILKKNFKVKKNVDTFQNVTFLLWCSKEEGVLQVWIDMMVIKL